MIWSLVHYSLFGSVGIVSNQVIEVISVTMHREQNAVIL